MATIIRDQSSAQGFVSSRLKSRVETRANRETLFIEPLLAIMRREFPPNLASEIIGFDDLSRIAPTCDDRGCLRLSCLARQNVSVFCHTLDHPVAPRFGSLRKTQGIVIVGRFRQRGKERRLTDRQLVY